MSLGVNNSKDVLSFIFAFLLSPFYLEVFNVLLLRNELLV